MHQAIRYQVIGKALVEQGGNHVSYAVKLLYKGDGTPWWACSAGLELPVSKELYEAVKPGASQITITIDTGGEG